MSQSELVQQLTNDIHTFLVKKRPNSVQLNIFLVNWLLDKNLKFDHLTKEELVDLEKNKRLL